MRVTALGVCVACLLPTALTTSAAAPASADDPTLQNIEALGNREPDRWQGRHHYLYDDEYRPETTGSTPSAKGCAEEIVRLQRSDGKYTVKRINRCD